MKKSTKIALRIFVLGVIVIGGYVYLVFNGNPITEHKLSLEEKAYAESKYGFKAKIVKTEYNFKDGAYQTTLQPADHPSFLVSQQVQPGGKKAFVDTYPESLWEKELKDQTLPTVKKLFKDANKIDIRVPTGSEYSLKGNEIPSYKTIEKVPFQIDLSLDSKYTEKENKRIFEIIDYLKKESFSYGVISVQFQDKTILIQDMDLNKIQSENDISNYQL